MRGASSGYCCPHSMAPLRPAARRSYRRHRPRAMPGTLCQAVDRSALQIRARSFPRIALASSASSPTHSASYRMQPSRRHGSRAYPVYFMRFLCQLHNRAQRAKWKSYEELRCIRESDHASYPAHCERHGSRRGFHGLTGTPPTPAKSRSHRTVPANIQVPPGNTAFLVGHAVGTRTTSACPQALASNSPLHAAGYPVQQRR